MSPVDNIPPATTRRPLREDRRLTDIERRRIITPTGTIATADEFPGFSTGEIATIGMIAAPWYARLAHSYVFARISCDSPAAGNCSFELELNGTLVITLTLGSGEITHVYTAVFSVNPDDRLGGQISAAAGQIGVSVQLEEAA